MRGRTKQLLSLGLTMTLICSAGVPAMAEGAEATVAVESQSEPAAMSTEEKEDKVTVENLDEADASGENQAEETVGEDENQSRELILHYDFESLKSGTIANDQSGKGKNGVVRPEGSQAETETVDIFGEKHTAFVMKGGQPDKTHTYMELPQGALNGLKDMTVSCWVYVNANSGYQRIWDFGSDTTSYMYLLTDGGNEGHTGYTAGLTNRGWSEEKGPESPTLETGKWIYTTVTFDGSEKKLSLYKDGVLCGSEKTDADLSVLEGSTKNWIGYGQFGNDIFNGKIADFKIYNYAMTDGEVAESYAVPDEVRLERDIAALTLGDTSGVTENLTLPATGSAGSQITWTTSDDSVVTADGVVTRPEPGQPAKTATLTAHLRAGESTGEKQFEITVLARLSDEEIVEKDLAGVKLENIGSVKEDLTLPTEGEYGSVLTWTSSDEAVISVDGKVTRPVGENKEVTLTVTSTMGGVSESKEFKVTVVQRYAKKEIKEVESVAVSTAKGVLPTFPKNVKVTFKDGSSERLKVTWPVDLNKNDFLEAGTKNVEGTLTDYEDVKVPAVVTITAEAGVVPAAPSAAEFDLSDISLDGSTSIYAQNNKRALEYLKIMDADRMLYNFRSTFGVDTKNAKPLTGWEEPTGLLRGHSTGHFLSGLSLAYSSTGDEAYKEKLDYMIHELRTLQEMSKGKPENFETACTPTSASQSQWSKDPSTWGEGFISAYSPDQFALLEQYTPYATIWAPYYTLHKLLAGFVDAYMYTGNEEALEIAKDLGNWIYLRLDGCTTPEQRSKMWSMYIAGEFGGMNESLARLYEITKDTTYRDAAKLFDNTVFFDNLASNVDDIKGRHANQHIPQIVGAIHEYAATGEKKYYNIAKNFWDMAVSRYSYSIGGVGTGETFKEPYRQGNNILGNAGRGENCETCAAYNMLKLTKDLSLYDPDNAEYMDYYERTLVNQIAASQSHETTESMHNGVTYMLPIDPGQRRDFDSDYGGFTCCNGTGMENHVKYQQAAYTKTEDTLYVNLYMPTTVDWEEKGVSVTQDTKFPSEQSTLTVGGSGSFKVKLRVPYWANKGFTVKVNGETICTNPQVSTFVEIDRNWSSGDKITIDMPYTLYLDETPDKVDGSTIASVMYGPLVMVAKDTRQKYTPMNWYTVSLDADVEKSVEIVQAAGDEDGKVPHLKTNGLDFFPMYDAYNYRYHAYVKVEEKEAPQDPQPTPDPEPNPNPNPDQGDVTVDVKPIDKENDQLGELLKKDEAGVSVTVSGNVTDEVTVDVTEQGLEEGDKVFLYQYDSKENKLIDTGKSYTVGKDGKVILSLDKEGTYVLAKVDNIQVGEVTELKSVTKSNAVTLTWDEVEGADGYRIYRYDRKEKKYKKIAQVKTNEFKDEDVTAGTGYLYKIRAQETGRKNHFGEYTAAFRALTKTAAPTGVKGKRISKVSSKSKGEISFNKVAKATAYRIYKYNKKADKYQLAYQIKDGKLSQFNQETKKFKRVGQAVTKKGVITCVLPNLNLKGEKTQNYKVRSVIAKEKYTTQYSTMSKAVTIK